MIYRVLIVDDEKIERNGIRFLLGQQGRQLEIAEAVNGVEALKWLSENRADVLITDVKMPLMNGIELLERVSGSCPDMKSVIFSGYGEFEYARQALRFGVEDYILKPVDPQEFREVMDRIFDSLQKERERKAQKEAEGVYFRKYVLNALVNGADPGALQKRTAGFSMDFLDLYRRMMLLELGRDFFGNNDAELMEELKEAAEGARFDYLNMNPQQCVLFFLDEVKDWKDTARRMNDRIARRCGSGIKSYISVSSGIRNREQIGSRYQELELLMENRFYDLDDRVYMAENEAETADDVRLDDDTLQKQIRQDIRARDILSLREHCAPPLRQLQQKTGLFPDVCEIRLRQPAEDALRSDPRNVGKGAGRGDGSALPGRGSGNPAGDCGKVCGPLRSRAEKGRRKRAPGGGDGETVHPGPLWRRAQRGNPGGKSAHGAQLLKRPLQKGDGAEPEQVHQGVPHGTGEGNAGKHLRKNRGHQREGGLSKRLLFLSELPGVLWGEPAEVP